jgi:hypothetical protein
VSVRSGCGVEPCIVCWGSCWGSAGAEAPAGGGLRGRSPRRWGFAGAKPPQVLWWGFAGAKPPQVLWWGFAGAKPPQVLFHVKLWSYC